MVSLLTGARRANVQGMQWQDLDLVRGVWRVPGEQSKNGMPMMIVLVEAVVEVLRKRREQVPAEVPWVFPATSQTGHIVEPKEAMARILKAAGIVNLRLHDLRRTLGSWQAAGGSSLLVIGKSLGHSSQSATAVYSRLNLDPVRASVTTATTAMLAAARPRLTDGQRPAVEAQPGADQQAEQQDDAVAEAQA